MPNIHFPSATNSLRDDTCAAVPVAGEVLADLLLVVPQQAVQGQDVAVADERQAVIDCVAGGAVGCDIQEKPGVGDQNNHQRAREMRSGRGAEGTAEQVPRSTHRGFHGTHLRAASKLLFTKSLKGRICSSFVKRTWLAIL